MLKKKGRLLYDFLGLSGVILEPSSQLGWHKIRRLHMGVLYMDW